MVTLRYGVQQDDENGSQLTETGSRRVTLAEENGTEACRVWKQDQTFERNESEEQTSASRFFSPVSVPLLNTSSARMASYPRRAIRSQSIRQGRWQSTWRGVSSNG